MGIIMPYGVAVREALAKQAKQTIRDHGDLTVALLDLLDAIDSLKNKK